MGVQEQNDRFLKERPIMKAHDTPERIVGFLRQELEEMLVEMQWGEREPTIGEVEKVKYEIADVVIYTLTLSSLLGFDLIKAVEEKLAINEKRFPAEMFKEGNFEEIYLARKIELSER